MIDFSERLFAACRIDPPTILNKLHVALCQPKLTYPYSVTPNTLKRLTTSILCDYGLFPLLGTALICYQEVTEYTIVARWEFRPGKQYPSNTEVFRLA